MPKTSRRSASKVSRKAVSRRPATKRTRAKSRIGLSSAAPRARKLASRVKRSVASAIGSR
jgi:hypothetical protein